VNINWCAVPGHEDDLSKVIVSMLDITERQKAEKELKHMSTHDALTGLYNRAFFDEEMARLEKDRQTPVSIIMADMDDLKATNDRFGHAAGDKLLRRAAKLLKESFRTEDVVARIGGDEFAVLLPNSSMEAAKMTIERIQSNLKMQNEVNPDLPLYISLGVSTAEKDQPLIEGLKLADENMYLEKQKKT
jgi:diguanylate cyclase (GGDEF)-like protein